MYDLYNQVCLRVLKINKEIKKIIWLEKTLLDLFMEQKKLRAWDFIPLNLRQKEESKIETENLGFEAGEIFSENIVSSEAIQTKEEVKIDGKLKEEELYSFEKSNDKKYSKRLNNEFGLIILLADNTILTWTPDDNLLQTLKLRMTNNVNSFDIAEVVDKENNNFLLTAFGTNKGEDLFVLNSAVAKRPIIIQHQKHTHLISSVRFNYSSPVNKILCASGGFDRKIVIYRANFIETNEISIDAIFSFK